MANDIVFVKGAGGLGRPLPGEDFVSGMVFYTSSLPSGWSSSARVKALFSVADAEANGILSDSSDATSATYTSVLTRGATGDTIKAVYTGIDGVIYDLGTYTQDSTDTTLALLGASYATYINSKTYLHGCTASFATATLTITLPKDQGVFPNTGTPLAFTVTGTITAATPALGNSGVASLQAVWHYQISEYFRLQPQGQLYVGFYAVPGTYTYAETTLVQNYSGGKIRQIGHYVDSKAFAVGDIQLLHNEIVTNCDANHKPMSAVYAGNIKATSDLSTLANLNTYTANKVSVVIGQDGAGLGNKLYQATGKSVCALGATLGAVSLASVSDDIAWVGKFNFSNGLELDTPAFGNGVLVRDSSASFLTALDNNRYIYFKKFVGLAGTFANDSHTAVIATSDYAYIENNRTIDKAIRGVYASVLPSLASPLLLNSDGTLTDETIAYFVTLANSPLAQMIRDAEVSQFLVTIDSAQNVLATSKLIIAIQIIPVGVARSIQVNIGFTTKIA